MDVIFNLGDFIEFPNVILFEYQHGSRRRTVLFNKKNNSSKIFDGIMDDLAFKINLEAHDFGIYSNFAWSDTNGVYRIISPDQMEKLIGLIHENKLNLNKEQKEKLKKLSNDSNPVLFYYEFK